MIRFVLGLVACSSIGCHSCKLPSEDVDANDSLGVFERDGGAEGGVVGRVPSASARPGSSAPAPVAVPRDPAMGPCVAQSGQPNRDLSRTVGRPACRRGKILEHRDGDGAPRYACVYTTSEDPPSTPRPLVIFFHPEHADPAVVRKGTNLAERTFEPAVDGARGFIVLAPQGRSIFGGARGVVFDTHHVDEANVDIQTVDHFVRVVVAEGKVDPRRIYTVGWGRGGEMAALYASVRADRVAAFASFASDAPPVTWTCPTPPPPAVIAYRACDALTSCESVENWLRVRDDAGADTLAVRLGAADAEESHCAVNKCGEKLGTANHQRWPEGLEPRLLTFLVGHTLSLRDRGATSP